MKKNNNTNYSEFNGKNIVTDSQEQYDEFNESNSEKEFNSNVSTEKDESPETFDIFELEENNLETEETPLELKEEASTEEKDKSE